MKRTACLLISCQDRRGLVAAIANFLLKHDANILHADQHQDAALGMFFMRVEWDLEGFALPLGRFKEAFEPVAQPLGMTWRVHSSDDKRRVVVFVSKQLHCLADLLYRHQEGELACEVRAVVSNHPDAERLAAFYQIPFHLVPVTPESKAAAETAQLKLLQTEKIDLVVLARYMQVLSAEFVARFPTRIINVHHSFLPAFVGADPYGQAFERGVKLIGATSHYVMEQLDDGPIIEQDVIRISHRDGVRDLASRGKDLEKVILSRAVRWHLTDRVVVVGRKTVVFD
jgi:formyltetrahydrofolate deformylase